MCGLHVSGSLLPALLVAVCPGAVAVGLPGDGNTGVGCRFQSLILSSQKSFKKPTINYSVTRPKSNAVADRGEATLVCVQRGSPSY